MNFLNYGQILKHYGLSYIQNIVIDNPLKQ